MGRSAVALASMLWVAVPGGADAGDVAVYVEERVDLTHADSASLNVAAQEAIREAGHKAIDLAPVASQAGVPRQPGSGRARSGRLESRVDAAVDPRKAGNRGLRWAASGGTGERCMS